MRQKHHITEVFEALKRSQKPESSYRDLVAQKIAEMSLDQVIKLLVFMDRLENENAEPGSHIDSTAVDKSDHGQMIENAAYSATNTIDGKAVL